MSGRLEETAIIREVTHDFDILKGYVEPPFDSIDRSEVCFKRKQAVKNFYRKEKKKNFKVYKELLSLL